MWREVSSTSVQKWKLQEEEEVEARSPTPARLMERDRRARRLSGMVLDISIRVGMKWWWIAR